MKTTNDYNQIIEDYNSVFVEAFEKTTRVNMVSTIGISESSRVLRLNRKLIQTTAAEFLGSKGVPIVQLNRPNDAVAILQSGVIQNPTVILNSVNHMIDTTKVFSSEHRKFMKRFIADMSNLQENGDGNQIIDLFNKEIIKSELLNEGEKIKLLLFGSQSYALLKFYKGEGSSEIYQSISKETGITASVNAADNARVTRGCKVSWRAVWGGAVGGGITGAIIGGTGGTVALPGVGTVTGAVAGGVFGFAKGFVGGAASGVAQELLLSCFSMIVSQEVYCRQYWERWERDEIGFFDIPASCQPEIDFTDFTMNPL